jgi:hypothetical protein
MAHFTRDKRDRNTWTGTVEGETISFTVVGTYGEDRNPIVSVFGSGDRLAIDFKTGKVLQRFGRPTERAF